MAVTISTQLEINTLAETIWRILTLFIIPFIKESTKLGFVKMNRAIVRMAEGN